MTTHLLTTKGEVFKGKVVKSMLFEINNGSLAGLSFTHGGYSDCYEIFFNSSLSKVGVKPFRVISLELISVSMDELVGTNGSTIWFMNFPHGTYAKNHTTMIKATTNQYFSEIPYMNFTMLFDGVAGKNTVMSTHGQKYVYDLSEYESTMKSLVVRFRTIPDGSINPASKQIDALFLMKYVD